MSRLIDNTAQITIRPLTYAPEGSIGNNRVSFTPSGNVLVYNTEVSSGVTIGSIVIPNGSLAIGGTSDSSSINAGGALSIAGGASIAKTLYVNKISAGSSIVISSTIGELRANGMTAQNLYLFQSASPCRLSMTNNSIGSCDIGMAANIGDFSVSAVPGDFVIRNSNTSNNILLGIGSQNAGLCVASSGSVSIANLLTGSATFTASSMGTLSFPTAETSGVFFGTGSKMYNTTTGVHVWSDTNVYLDTGGLGTNRVFIGSTGNVGINTSSGTQQFEVKGALNCTSGNFVSGLTASSATIGSTITTNASTANLSATNSTLSNAAVGAVSTSSLSFSTLSGSTNGIFFATASRIYDNADLHIWTDDNMYIDVGGGLTSGTNVMHVSPSGVGINTTSHSSQLEVKGAIVCSSANVNFNATIGSVAVNTIVTTSNVSTLNLTSSNVFFVNATSAALVISNTGDSSLTLKTDSTVGSLEIARTNFAAHFSLLSAPGNTIIRTQNTAGKLIFGIGDASTLVINSGGNVGIGGIANPTNKLEVIGGIKSTSLTAGSVLFSSVNVSDLLGQPRVHLTNTTYGYGAVIALAQTAGNYSFSAKKSDLVILNGNTDGSMILQTAATSPSVFISSGGNIGLNGITVPSVQLHGQNALFTDVTLGTLRSTSFVYTPDLSVAKYNSACSMSITNNTNGGVLELGYANATGHFSTDSTQYDAVIRNSHTGKNILFQVGPGTSGMTVSSSGNIGIGTGSTHPNYSLTVNGDISASGDIYSFNTVSDVRFKDNIETLDISLDAIATIGKLRPVSFRWKDNIPNESRRGTTDIGFIAQEVHAAIPEATGAFKVHGEDDTEYLNIKYEKLIVYLVKAVQELTTKLQM